MNTIQYVEYKSGPWGSGSETDISFDEGVNMDATVACQQGSKGDYEREIAV